MSRRRRREVTGTPVIVLDSGGLTALSGRSLRARATMAWLVGQEGQAVVPAPVLVEGTTGDGRRDAEVNRVLRVVLGTDEPASADQGVARLAGRLRHRAQTDDGIDALVAAEAVKQGQPSVVMTSDPNDLKRLLREHPDVTVHSV